MEHRKVHMAGPGTDSDLMRCYRLFSIHHQHGCISTCRHCLNLPWWRYLLIGVVLGLKAQVGVVKCTLLWFGSVLCNQCLVFCMVFLPSDLPLGLQGVGIMGCSHGMPSDLWWDFWGVAVTWSDMSLLRRLLMRMLRGCVHFCIIPFMIGPCMVLMWSALFQVMNGGRSLRAVARSTELESIIAEST